MNPLRIIVSLLEKERHRWALWLPVAIGAGIALYFALDVEPSILWLALTPAFVALTFFSR